MILLDIHAPSAPGGWVNVTGHDTGWCLLPDPSWWPAALWLAVGIVGGVLIGLHLSRVVSSWWGGSS